MSCNNNKWSNIVSLIFHTTKPSVYSTILLQILCLHCVVKGKNEKVPKGTQEFVFWGCAADRFPLPVISFSYPSHSICLGDSTVLHYAKSYPNHAFTGAASLWFYLIFLVCWVINLPKFQAWLSSPFHLKIWETAAWSLPSSFHPVFLVSGLSSHRRLILVDLFCAIFPPNEHAVAAWPYLGSINHHHHAIWTCHRPKEEF